MGFTYHPFGDDIFLAFIGDYRINAINIDRMSSNAAYLQI